MIDVLERIVKTAFFLFFGVRALIDEIYRFIRGKDPKNKR